MDDRPVVSGCARQPLDLGVRSRLVAFRAALDQRSREDGRRGAPVEHASRSVEIIEHPPG